MWGKRGPPRIFQFGASSSPTGWIVTAFTKIGKPGDGVPKIFWEGKEKICFNHVKFEISHLFKQAYQVDTLELSGEKI